MYQFTLNTRITTLMIRTISTVSIVAATALLISSAVFRHQVLTTQKDSSTSGLKQIYNLTHRHDKTKIRTIDGFTFKKSACDKHFLSMDFPVLTNAMIILSVIKISFALTEMWPTFMRRDKMIMLSIWLSRALETEMYISAIMLFVCFRVKAVAASQKIFLQDISTDILKWHDSNIIQDPTLHCAHITRDSFVALQMVNTVIALIKAAVVILVGFFCEQSDEKSETSPLLGEMPLKPLEIKKEF